jgi:hypothetical protein
MSPVQFFLLDNNFSLINKYIFYFTTNLCHHKAAGVAYLKKSFIKHKGVETIMRRAKKCHTYNVFLLDNNFSLINKYIFILLLICVIIKQQE